MQTIKLGDIAEIRGRVGWRGYTVDDLIDSGPLVIGANEITSDNQLNLTNAKHLTREKYEESPEIFIRKDDILVVKVGSTIGKVCIIDKEIGEASINPNCVIVRATKISPYYLYLYLSSPEGRFFLTNNSSASGQPALNQTTLKKMPVYVPDISVQKKAEEIIYPINHLCELNQSIICTISLSMREIYDYWFVQFDFPDKNGRPYKTSGGKMIWNDELDKEIPDGWKVENLMSTSLCRDIKAGVDYFDKKIYLPTASINGETVSNGNLITFNGRETRANMQPQLNSVWFAKMKSSVKHLSIPSAGQWFVDRYILSTGFQGLKCSPISFPFIHCLINSEWFEMYKDQLSHGATQQGVNSTDLKNVCFVVPNQELLEKFSQICNPLLEMKFKIMQENQELAELRDWLLPMLMNGQVKVKN